jgi:hypothetical protein
MFEKMAALVVSMGVIACVLLSLRQQRVQAAHELAEVQRRVLEHDRTLWRLRAELAAQLTPEKVERASKKFGPLLPNGPDRLAELLKREAEEPVVTSAVDGRTEDHAR